MSLKFELKVSGVWTDITSYALECEGNLKTTNIVDEITANILNTVSDISSIDVGMDYRLNNNGVYPFSGSIIETKTVGNMSTKLVVRSYSNQFLNIFVNEYYENVSPEYIVQDVITKYTDLTYTSSMISGITLKQFTIKNKLLVNVLDTLTTIMMAQITIDTDKNLSIEPRGYSDTGLTFTLGEEIINIPTWSKNTNNVINKITFIGDDQVFNHTDNFTGDGTTDTFTLTYKPKSIDVSVAGVLQKPEVSGSTVAGDYTVNTDLSQITFNSGSIPVSGSAIVVNYTYGVPINITTQASSSITPDEIRWKKITNKSIKTYADGRKYISQIFARYGVPTYSSNNVSIDDWYPELINNSKAKFIDSKSGINEDLVISQIRFKYPVGSLFLVVGNEDKSYADYQKDAYDKIQEIQSNLNSAEIIQEYIGIVETISVSITNTQTRKYRYLNDTSIADDAGTHPNCIVYDADKAFIVDDFESTTDWTVTNGSVVSDTTTNHFWVGTQGIKLTTTSASSSIVNTTITNDMSNVVGVTSGTPIQGTAGVWIYTDIGSNINSIKLKIGNSSSVYAEYTATVYANQNILDNELTLLQFDLDVPDSVVGTVDWTNITYIEININSVNVPNITFDYLTVSMSDDISLCGMGERQGNFINL